MFLKKKNIRKRHASYIKTVCKVCKLHLYSVFEVFENKDFVFFAYFKEKLNAASSFRVFTL